MSRRSLSWHRCFFWKRRIPKRISSSISTAPAARSLRGIGLAASFGAFLLAGGTRGKRIALPNAEILIHQPAISGNGVHGQATEIQIVSDHIQKSKLRLNRILAENTGKSAEQIAADTERDHYMTAQEALEYGLIDKILERR